MPTRGDAAWHAVTITMVSPERTITEPSACLASLPVSMLIVRAPMVMSRRCAVGIMGKSKEESRDSKGESRRPSAAGAPPDDVEIWLLADAELLDELRVAIRVLTLEVVQEP